MDLHDPFDLLLIQQIVMNFPDEDDLDDAPARRYFNAENPFDNMSEKQFVKCFRLTKDLTAQLINILAPHMRRAERASAKSIATKVLVALRFFASGSYQEVTGSNIYLGVSQSSVSRFIAEVCEALNSAEIFNTYVRFPQNMQDLNQLRNRFYQKYNFPGVIGCIDCTHVAIVPPPRNHPVHPENIYVNRKRYHSINVQLVCDENLRILNVNSRFPGSCHDAHIFNMSNISTTLERIYDRNQENPFFLVGDSGYPLRPWLMIPLANVAEGTPEERFNKKFCSMRNTIERCNGVLKNRFRCLLKDRTLHYAPDMASKIINACVVLHNMCIDANVPEPDNDLGNDIDWGIIPQQHLENDRNDVLTLARSIRNNIVRNYF